MFRAFNWTPGFKTNRTPRKLVDYSAVLVSTSTDLRRALHHILISVSFPLSLSWLIVLNFAVSFLLFIRRYLFLLYFFIIPNVLNFDPSDFVSPRLLPSACPRQPQSLQALILQSSFETLNLDCDPARVRSRHLVKHTLTLFDSECEKVESEKAPVQPKE